MKLIATSLYCLILSNTAYAAVLSSDVIDEIPTMASSSTTPDASSKTSSGAANTNSSQSASAQSQSASTLAADSASDPLQNSTDAAAGFSQEPQFYKPSNLASGASGDSSNPASATGTSSFGNFSGLAGAKSVGQSMTISKDFALGALKNEDENQTGAV